MAAYSLLDCNVSFITDPHILKATQHDASPNHDLLPAPPARYHGGRLPSTSSTGHSGPASSPSFTFCHGGVPTCPIIPPPSGGPLWRMLPHLGWLTLLAHPITHASSPCATIPMQATTLIPTAYIPPKPCPPSITSSLTIPSCPLPIAAPLALCTDYFHWGQSRLPWGDVPTYLLWRRFHRGGNIYGRSKVNGGYSSSSAIIGGHSEFSLGS